MSKKSNAHAYDQVITAVFRKRFGKEADVIPFSKDDLIDAANEAGLRIKNVADILYTFRSRRDLPPELQAKGNWVIASHGSGRYAFERVKGKSAVEIPTHIKTYPIPYAVPEIVATHIAGDEQGLLTIVRYNRLLDVFTGVACFHLQSHVRTQVRNHGQVEVDDLYVGVDKNGAGYVLPIEAKAENESLGIDKAVALTLFAKEKYPRLICRPIAVIRQSADTFVCIEFEPSLQTSKVSILDMRRYRLVEDVKK
jgi:hypothetical protein